MRVSTFISSFLLLSVSVTPLPVDFANHRQRRSLAQPIATSERLKTLKDNTATSGQVSSDLEAPLLSNSHDTFNLENFPFPKEPPSDPPTPHAGWYERFRRKSNVNFVMARIYDAERDERARATKEGKPEPNLDLPWLPFLDKMSAMTRRLWNAEIGRVVSRDKGFRREQEKKILQFKGDRAATARKDPMQYQKLHSPKDPQEQAFYDGLAKDDAIFRQSQDRAIETANRHWRNVQAWIREQRETNPSPSPGQMTGADRWAAQMPIPGQALFL